MNTVLERIAAWQAAGLIDEATADRLRAAEPPDTPEPAPLPARHPSVATAAGSFFGPTPTIVEMFGYLGALFLIAAWSAFLVRIAGDSGTGGSNDTILAVGAGVSAAVLLGIGVALRNSDARRRRAGGAAILVATLSAIAAGGFLGQSLGLNPATSAIVAAAAGFLVGTLGRIVLPAVTTQAAFLLALTSLGWAVLVWLQPQSREDLGFDSFEPASDVVTMVIVPAIGWLLLAVGLGALGLAEAGTPGAPAQRRAGLTRFWAGLVAVVGVSFSVFTSGSLGNGDYGRLLEPWIGELAVLVVSLVLVERAFRRESSAFILAAAIGLITALTDFNFTYLTSSTDVGLLVEGLILISAGVAADRLRRRIDRSRAAPPDDARPDDAPPVDAPLVETTPMEAPAPSS
jgi:hypothetical protein